MKGLVNYRAVWLLIPLILLVQIIAGLSERAQATDWQHERVPQVTPQTAETQTQREPTKSDPAPLAGKPGADRPSPTQTGNNAQPQALPLDPANPTPLALISSGAANVPILVYHHISDSRPNTRYYTPVSQFTAQMQMLSDQGYTPITMTALIDSLEGRAPLPPHPIVITFDDVPEDVYQNAFPVMQSLGFPGVVYVVVKTMGGQGYLSSDQIIEMLWAGWEVGSHSRTHADLSQPGVDLGQELNQSQQDLQAELGTPVQSFAYPYAVTSESIFQAVEAAGYTNAVCSGWSNTQRLASRYCLSRREVMPEMDLKAFQKLIEEP